MMNYGLDGDQKEAIEYAMAMSKARVIRYKQMIRSMERRLSRSSGSLSRDEITNRIEIMRQRMSLDEKHAEAFESLVVTDNK
jgi:hypothetical protein